MWVSTYASRLQHAISRLLKPLAEVSLSTDLACKVGNVCISIYVYMFIHTSVFICTRMDVYIAIYMCVGHT